MFGVAKSLGTSLVVSQSDNHRSFGVVHAKKTIQPRRESFPSPLQKLAICVQLP